MGCIVSSVSTWVPPGGEASLNYLNDPKFAEKTYGASYEEPKGSEKGSLSGKVAFKVGVPGKKSELEFSKMDCDTPTIDLSADDLSDFSFAATAFFPCGMEHLPVGEGMVRKKWHATLGGKPRQCAVYVWVDGEARTDELVAKKCFDYNDEHWRDCEELQKPVPGTFFSYWLIAGAEGHNYAHLPMLCPPNLKKSLDGGYHGWECTDAFLNLYKGLSSGEHTIKVEVKVSFDHTNFHYYCKRYQVADWERGSIDNTIKDLADPHTNPKEIVWTPVLASGEVKVIVGDKTSDNLVQNHDWKIPESGYFGSDAEEMKKIAIDAVGGCQWGKKLKGAPTHMVLTSGICSHEWKNVNNPLDKDCYNKIEIAALWRGKGGPEDEDGKMLLAEIRQQHEDKSGRWRYSDPPMKRPVPKDIRNKYIDALS